MEFARLVSVSRQVAATRSRTTKRSLIADLLSQAEPDELGLVTAYLSGTLRQRRTGVGWRGLAELPPPAAAPRASVTEVDAALEQIAELAGPGSGTARREAVTALFARLTTDEQRYLRGLVTGEVRQGALDSVVLDAIAEAAHLPATAVRRAAMFSALTGPIAVAALSGGEEALAAFDLEVGRPVRPMLASSAPDVPTGFGKVGSGSVVVDTKLDGIRIQVHRRAGEILVFTRSLDEISPRLPDVVDAVRRLPGGDLVLDGEALTLADDGSPRPFQETASRTSATDRSDRVHPFFFDLLAHDGVSLVHEPASTRLARLDDVVPPAMRTARLECDDAEAVAAFFAAAVAAGQEGVILKDPEAPYAAGRRGSAWVKVKPRHTLDLVVLAVEWGSGRRQGWLSNIWLGARDGAEGWVMLGKTFKGMTDEMLAWQTERFLALETHRERHVVHVRPEQVVEIAFDGLQRSTRYPGGVALRFARVVGYRDDKTADEADTIETVRALAGHVQPGDETRV